jgi:hypothetical protein
MDLLFSNRRSNRFRRPNREPTEAPGLPLALTLADAEREHWGRGWSP